MSKIIDTSETSKSGVLWRKPSVMLALVVLAVIVAGAIWTISQKQAFFWQGKPSASQNKDNKPPDYNSLVVGIDKNNYSEAIRELEAQLAGAKDDKARAALYVQMSSLALKTQAYDDALEFAKKAEQLYTTPSTTAVVAKCAEAKGDKELAITYYKKAIAGLNPNTENGQGDIEIYTAAIKKLGGTP